ncbi:MAG: leucine-rich repeat protein [Acetobacter sp.]|nr:leucine-rich repeat protein [Bacteroides sp.]MCM1341548.1 leucine-rich repeat protein [Acetobacter sp.]MCM1433625.1 leucine-rich repeat protein [Clostridiales bacterium]
MKRISKIISIIMALIMLITSMPVYASAFLKSDDGLFTYRILYSNDNETVIELDNYVGTDSTVVVPAELDGCRVAGLNRTFDSKTSVKKVVISEGIEYISSWVFRNCSSITVTLPSTLKYISGEGAFQRSTIRSINFPEGLELISSKSFSGTVFANTDIVLPDSLKYIENQSFYESNISSVSIGSQTNIMSADFSEYGVDINVHEYEKNELQNPFAKTELKDITLRGNNPYITVHDGALYTYDMKTVLAVPFGEEDQYEDFYEMPGSVDHIAKYAFSTAYIDTVIFNSKIEKISSLAFSYTNVNSFKFGKTSRVKEIDSDAFAYSEINKIIIPKGVKILNGFKYSSVTSVLFETPSSCTSIADGAFQNCINLKNIDIPASVNNIGVNSFEFCTSLETVNFKKNSHLITLNDVFSTCKNLKQINFEENSALQSVDLSLRNTKIESIDFSNCNKLQKISASTFKGSKTLKNVDFSNTALTEIPAESFSECSNLKNVILSNSTIILNDAAFYNCKALTDINLDSIMHLGENVFYGNSKYKDIKVMEEQLYQDFLYYEGTESISISGYQGNKKELVIPNYINGKPVTRILSDAFSKTNLTSVSLPIKLERIECNAFYMCKNLSKITPLPDTLQTIGEKAFYYCGVSGDLIIPDSVVSIDNEAFNQCSNLTNLILGKGLKSIGDKAFFGCGFDNFVIPENIDYIGSEALVLTSTVHLEVNSPNVNIEELLFSDVWNRYANTLESISVGDKVTNYCTDSGVLYNKDKTKLLIYPRLKLGSRFAIPDTVKEIAEYAFAGNHYLENVTLSKSLEIIDRFAFQKMETLNSVFLPNSLKAIENDAFKECNLLERVEFEEGSRYNYIESAFADCCMLSLLVIPENMEIEYFQNTFENCSSLKAVDLKCKVKYLSGTFYNSALEEIKLYDGLVSIEQYAFYQTNLKSIVIPNTVNSISNNVFEKCIDLSYVNLANVKSLGKECFAYCFALESIDLTYVLYYYQGISENSTGTFKCCSQLKKFYFTQDEREAYIAEKEFCGNGQLETIVVGNAVTEIKDYAFADCTNLETAFIADSVTTIADTAFENCDNLTIICLEDSYVEFYAEKKSIPCETFVIAPIPDQEYTGKAITPEVNVTVKNRSLGLNKDYIASYSDNINVGSAKVTVLGLGDYSIFGAVGRFNIVKSNNIPPAAEIPDNKNDAFSPSYPSKPIDSSNDADSISSVNSEQNDNNDYQDEFEEENLSYTFIKGSNSDKTNSSSNSKKKSSNSNKNTDVNASVNSKNDDRNITADTAKSNEDKGSVNKSKDTAQKYNNSSQNAEQNIDSENKENDETSREDDENTKSSFFKDRLMSFWQKILKFIHTVLNWFRNLFK